MALNARWSGNKLQFHDGANVIFEIDGTNLQASTTAQKQNVNTAAASQSVTAAQSGQMFIGAVDAVFTLPAVTSALKGVWFTFTTGVASSGTGLAISPAAADFIGGNGLTQVVNKDLINTGATDRVGDSVTIYCDGTAWWIEALLGTWAKET